VNTVYTLSAMSVEQSVCR